MVTAHEIRLASRPKDWPEPDNFSLIEVALPELAEGQVLIENLYMSVDPYMRGRMNDAKSYVAPFQLGRALEGAAIGEVLESKAAGLAKGDLVLSSLGWRDRFVALGSELRKLDRKIEPPSAYLGVLGVTGLTAWVGLKLGEAKAGDRVFISAAAGATGSVAGQLAKLRGCRVIGSAGSADKVKLLTSELGFDAAFNYKDGDLVALLKQAAPDGIDVYFDNVGGAQLEAAIHAMRVRGRIIACGAISQYNESTRQGGPRNLELMIGKRLTMKGFIVLDWLDQMPAFLAEVGPAVAAGKLKTKETVVSGLANAPQAFIDLMRGENVGKMVVKLR